MSGPAGYDPEARRDTPLALKLKERIRREGPIPVSDYMAACLADPEHGYYRTRTAIGGKGDFITAPEISQVFGELIGLWAAVVWQMMGSPRPLNLVELGPGRGTLMADALRACRIVPGFLEAVHVVLVDIAPSEGLRLGALPEDRVSRLGAVSDIPADVPAIVIANEFLDTCPVQQFEVVAGICRIRGVGLEDGRLAMVTLPAVATDWDQDFFAANPGLADGAIIEAQDFSVLHTLRHGRTAPWAALFIDYGHFDPSRGIDVVVPGDSLQAVRGHAYEHPLTSPGEADLTCHVDFNDVRQQFQIASPLHPAEALSVDGPVTQAELLGRLGAMERASRLMAANPGKAHQIEAGIARLMAVPGMGDRFKAIGVRSAGLPPLPGF